MDTDANRRYEDIESVNCRQGRAFPRTSPSATLLPALVCLVMLLSSFVVSSQSHADPDIGPADSQGPVPAHGSQARAWDWYALASDDGFVDVIVVLSDPESVEGAVSLCAEAERGICGPAREFRPSFTYSASVNGFAASMTPEAVLRLSSAVPDAVIYPDLPVNATLSKSVKGIGADQVWGMRDSSDVLVTGEGMVVAVIDTGIDYTHPDLGGGIGPAYKVIGGYDFVNRDSNPMDDNGHGTHVAGIIAADGDIVGVAPSAKLLAYKVLGSDGSGSMSAVVSAIDLALDPNGDGLYDDRADIISMSLGGAGDPDDPVCQAVARAISRGAVVVVAAGNEGPSLGTVASPGMAYGAVTVGAVDEAGIVASFSSRGPVGDLVMKPEVTAPGVQIVSTVPFSNARYSSPTGYMAMSGTSMATPHVSGAAALILQMHPDWTPSMVKSVLVSGSVERGESYWVGGAGEVWVPDSVGEALFSSTPLVSYGLAGSAPATVTVSCPGAGVSLSSDSDDWYSLSAAGVQAAAVQTTLSSVSPSYLSIVGGGSGTFTLTVSGSVSSVPEGYYDGEIILTAASLTHRIPFGFVVLCRLDVHVFNDAGSEVSDPYGGVFVYSLPGAEVALSKKGYIEPSPPASFLVPSGTYSVHALGHQLTYVYSDPYLLSATVTLARMSDVDVNLRMSEARELTVDLETEDGQPIFVKDFRMYVRHEGTRNVSFDMTGSDYSIEGSELFSVRRSMVVHVSDTAAQVGIQVSGFSYTPAMWRFMELNWDHWFEYVSGLSTKFMFEASADLQYLLAWEYDGVGPGTPALLTWDDGTSRYYQTEYDIPGTVTNPWCDWGEHRSMGGDAAFFVRRDTDTSLNSFFSGMTRTTVVHGTFVELYYPRGLFEGFVERQYYSPDYDHLVRAATTSKIYLPDRNFLSPLPPGTISESVGAGPYYPSVFTDNTGTELIIYHPLLRDQSGSRVGGKSSPSMNLYRNGGLLGMYQLSEYLARPDAVRYVDLPGSGTYLASVKYAPSSQVYDDLTIELGFVVPSSDLDPPRMTGMQMSQRYVPGQPLPLSFTAADSMSSVMASVSWRPSGTTTWTSLSVSQQSGVFSATVPTTQSSTGVDIKIELVDTSGNFLRYTAKHASLAQVPAVFELSVEDNRVSYSAVPDQVVLTGKLTDSSGKPLSTIAAVPVELYVDDKKVAMVLDEYMTYTSHTHDGRIRFDWVVDPTVLFTGPNQTVEVRASFDLGIYAPVEVSFQLRSVFASSIPPQVTLVSPANGAIIPAGEPIVVQVLDDGAVVFQYSVDGGALQTLAHPYEIDTSSWADGAHVVGVVVTDDDGNTVSVSYTFDVDATAPVVSVSVPIDGHEVPKGYTLGFLVTDLHMSSVTSSVDGAAPAVFPHPYEMDLTSWSLGMHSVVVTAEDAVGHISSLSITFEIVDSTLVMFVLTPPDGSVVRSGTPVSLCVLSTGTPQCRWAEAGVQHVLSEPFVIDTVGWAEGSHDLVLNATDDLGSSAEFSFSVVVDDTDPVISLISPDPGSFVTPGDTVTIKAYDLNFEKMVWSLNGFVGESRTSDVSISLSYFLIEGDLRLQISAHDMAGNVAEESVMYVMDISAPVISVSGVRAGAAISPDGSIGVSVTDPLLSTVACSVDSLPVAGASSSFSIEMSGLALGWHDLEVMASDRGGFQSSVSISFYVDGTPPQVTMTSGGGYVEGLDFEVSAAAYDDFGVGSVVCVYESSDGSFVELAMAPAEDGFVGHIPASALWDGMSITVVATDTVGNSAETSAVALTPGSGGSGGGLFGPFSLLGSVVAVVSIVFVSLAVLGIRGRRRGSAGGSKGLQQGPGADGSPGASAAHVAAGMAVPAQPVLFSDRPQPQSHSVSYHAHEVDRLPVVEAVSLSPLEAAPAAEQPQVPTEEDYLDQLEQVLNLSLVSRPTDGHDWDGLHLGKTSEPSPLKVSGLTLKKLMEKDH